MKLSLLLIILPYMDSKDIKRLSRLIAILTRLQSKRLLTAAEFAAKFSVSIRTIYRDIKALEEAGVPVISEEGRGYSLMEGYRLPPVMFSETEANALITAEQLVMKNKDASFVKEYCEAVTKIKAVLRSSVRDKADLLSGRIVFRQNAAEEKTSNYLSQLQLALTGNHLVKLSYTSIETGKNSDRTVEPFALYSTQENWLLVAWCRLRKEYRSFRLDGINDLQMLTDTFKPHDISLQQYFEMCRQKSFKNP